MENVQEVAQRLFFKAGDQIIPLVLSKRKFDDGATKFRIRNGRVVTDYEWAPLFDIVAATEDELVMATLETAVEGKTIQMNGRDLTEEKLVSFVQAGIRDAITAEEFLQQTGQMFRVYVDKKIPGREFLDTYAIMDTETLLKRLEEFDQHPEYTVYFYPSNGTRVKIIRPAAKEKPVEVVLVCRKNKNSGAYVERVDPQRGYFLTYDSTKAQVFPSIQEVDKVMSQGWQTAYSAVPLATVRKKAAYPWVITIGAASAVREKEDVFFVKRTTSRVHYGPLMVAKRYPTEAAAEKAANILIMYLPKKKVACIHVDTILP